MKLYLYILFSIFYKSVAYKSYTKITDHYIPKYEKNDNIYHPKCLFYTGGNSVMPEEIYSSFLNELADQGLCIYTINPSYKDNFVQLKHLCKQQPITLIGHSSGCTEMLKTLPYLDIIKNIIMIDPVNSNFKKIGKVIDIPKTVEKIDLIYADKSYKGSFIPFKVPFVPSIFSLRIKDFNFKNVDSYSFEDYGHCDILDYPWGKLMNNLICEGVEERNEIKIKEYHNEIATHIYNSIMDFSNDVPTNDPVKDVDWTETYNWNNFI